MELPRYRQAGNAHLRPKTYERTKYREGDTQVVPDDTLTLREIMERHVRGMNMDTMYREPSGYVEDADFDDPDLQEVKGSDIFDQGELLAVERERVANLKERLREAERASGNVAVTKEAKLKAVLKGSGAKAEKKLPKAKPKVKGSDEEQERTTLS